MKTIKYLLLLVIPATAMLSGCYKDDIDGLKKKQREAEERLAALEAWQASINTNIATLQIALAALENNDSVTNVAPVYGTGTAVIGYTIKFQQAGAITIYHGEKGDKGAEGGVGEVPVISVKVWAAAEGGDDRYYWTLDGDWLLDDGDRIPATGADGTEGTPGKDAVAPEVRIENGYWEYSTDGGSSWTSTGVKAVGEDGAAGNGGDPMFLDVDFDDDYIYLTMNDGENTQISLPRYRSEGISLSEVPAAFDAGVARVIGFSSTGTNPPTSIRAIEVTADWSVAVNVDACEITVNPPSTVTDYNRNGSALLLVLSDTQVVSVYDLEFTVSVPTHVASNTVGALYYESGETAGVVYKVASADGANDGLIMHKRIDGKIVLGAYPETLGTRIVGVDGDNNPLSGAALMTQLKTFPEFESLEPWATAASLGDNWFVPHGTEAYISSAGVTAVSNVRAEQGWDAFPISGSNVLWSAKEGYTISGGGIRANPTNYYMLPSFSDITFGAKTVPWNDTSGLAVTVFYMRNFSVNDLHNP